MFRSTCWRRTWMSTRAGHPRDRHAFEFENEEPPETTLARLRTLRLSHFALSLGETRAEPARGPPGDRWQNCRYCRQFCTRLALWTPGSARRCFVVRRANRLIPARLRARDAEATSRVRTVSSCRGHPTRSSERFSLHSRPQASGLGCPEREPSAMLPAVSAALPEVPRRAVRPASAPHSILRSTLDCRVPPSFCA